jgi:hypothetical protein
MPKYNHHSLALSDEEEVKYQEVKNKTSHGIKKIFMLGLSSELNYLINTSTKNDEE